jgi:Zn-dependent protease
MRGFTLQLLKIDYLGQPLRLEGSMAGWQEVFWNNELVSQKPASADPNGEFTHEFTIRVQPGQSRDAQVDGQAEQPAPISSDEVLHCRIETEIQWQPFEIRYQLYVNNELAENGTRSYKDIEQQVPFELPPPKKSISLVSLTTMAVKLFKSAKMIKLALAGVSMMIYSWLFSLTFAAALLISLMFHEWGHIQAMKAYGIKTRGFYLIPFFGGFAMRDEKVNTRWQAIVITMMGPCFGLLMSLFYMLIYGLTGDLFFGALAVFNALINLFNLLPILPLDGGHILKNISFSMNTKGTVALLVALVGLGCYASYSTGLLLIALLMGLGCIEILAVWHDRHNTHLLPLDHYAQLFAAVWYAVIAISLIGVIWFFAGMGDDVLGLPLRILQS